MIVQNVQYFHNLDFDKYLAMDGVSFSSLKEIEIKPSPGMTLGSRVHAYLNEPEKYDWKDAEIVIPIAKELRKVVGEAFEYMDKELSFIADFIHNGMLLKYKGRADAIKVGSLVVDFKVLSGSLDTALNIFFYDKQQSGYCLATGCKHSLIIAYNKSKKIVERKLIKPNADYWEYQCVRKGQPFK